MSSFRGQLIEEAAASVFSSGSDAGRVPSLPAQAHPSPGVEDPSGELLEFNEYQALLRERLGPPVLSLFAELTGLPLHLLWHQPPQGHGLSDLPVVCPEARRRSSLDGVLPGCQACQQRFWMPLGLTGNRECHFTGSCGAGNVCVNVQLPGFCPLTLVAQAPPPHRGARLARRNPVRSFPCVAELLRWLAGDLETAVREHLDLP